MDNSCHKAIQREDMFSNNTTARSAKHPHMKVKKTNLQYRDYKGLKTVREREGGERGEVSAACYNLALSSR